MSEEPEPTEAAPTKGVWRRRLFEGLLFLAALLALHLWQTRGTAEGNAPELRGPGLDGELVQLEGPALVHFWATWCGVCDAMDDNVASVAADHPVITVASRSEGPAAIRAHLREEELEGAFPVIADPGGELARRWGVSAYPTTFAIDAEGNIAAVSVGYTTTAGLRARMALAD
jgi:thiol-disulfide isomerase/thioredoxin